MVLLVATTWPLVDARRGGELIDSPWLLLLLALSGYVVGACCRAAVVALLCPLGAVALMWASHVHDPHAYSLLDDFVFFLAVLGGTALAGAAMTSWAGQVRDLSALSRQRAEQRAAEVRVARIEEHNRVEARLQHSIIPLDHASALHVTARTWWMVAFAIQSRTTSSTGWS